LKRLRDQASQDLYIGRRSYDKHRIVIRWFFEQCPAMARHQKRLHDFNTKRAKDMDAGPGLLVKISSQ